MARLKHAIGPGKALTSSHHTQPKPGAVTLPYNSTLFEDNAAPAGTYNPQVQQEVERGREGLNDYLEKLETEAHRGNVDAAQRARELRRSYGETAADNRRRLGYDQADLGYRLGQLGINFSRAITDLSTAKQRGEQDYERTLTNMQHEYGARAEQQAQNAIQQGTDEAGTNQASSAVRAANQRFDKGNVDLSHNRAEEDFATREGRLRQDYQSDVDRANEGFGRQQEETTLGTNRAFETLKAGLAANARDYARKEADRRTGASHAERTQTNYETHAAEDSIYEANKLHPNLHFPGGTDPATPTGGPHAYAVAPAVAVTHRSNGGTTAPLIGGYRGRLRAPRY